MSTIPVPTNAVAAQPLSKEERRKRYDALRAQAGRSMIEARGPAGKTGYWARKDDSTELYRLQAIGFSIVHDDPKNRAWEAGGFQADGTFIISDVILLEIDTELYEIYLTDNAERSDAMINGGKTGFLQRAAEQGIPAFDTSQKKG
jgi:hypothetical protein